MNIITLFGFHLEKKLKMKLKMKSGQQNQRNTFRYPNLLANFLKRGTADDN